MNSIQITPLGAGQDVGRSCILLSLGPKNILLDCGMHMGFEDERRFPDFSYISKRGQFNALIDAVLVSHFHLDHCGSLPYFTEMCGYDGPVYMSEPTRAICPLLLEDYRKITVAQNKDIVFFTSDDIKNCMAKVVTIGLHETISIDDELEIKAYYAGHVLGAVMFYIKYRNLSVVYTGDYNMTADRHLGAAWIDKLHPDILITETTYATTVRDSKKARERDFLQKVHKCVDVGGKVLIPVFALGRAQELCILIESYWERMKLRTPIYFSAGMTQKANAYYRMYIKWTNEKLKSTFPERNMFDFRHIKPFDMSYVDHPGAQVLFASPGMLHAGFSLEVFKKWAVEPKNMVILPGYCVPGTVGARVLAGEKQIDLDKITTINVNLQVEHLSFSAHADAKGILQLIEILQPKNVVLVHGEAKKMNVLKERIEKNYGIKAFFPANGENICFKKEDCIDVMVDKSLLEIKSEGAPEIRKIENYPPRNQPFNGIITGADRKKARLISIDNFKEKKLEASWLHFETSFSYDAEKVCNFLSTTEDKVQEALLAYVYECLKEKHLMTCMNYKRVVLNTFSIEVIDGNRLNLFWDTCDGDIGQAVIEKLKTVSK